MRIADTNMIEVTFARFGHPAQTIEVPEDSTVAQVLEKLDIQLASNEKVSCEGVEANLASIVEDGDVITTFTPKQGGSR